MNINDLTKEELIKVIANMHDVIQTWDQGYGLNETEAKTLNEIGSAAVTKCVNEVNFNLPKIEK